MALRTCCGCISLKTGSLIIGILSLIGCLIILIVACVLPGITNALVEQIAQNNANSKEILNTFLKGCSSGVITYALVMTIVVIFFVIGVVNMNPNFIVPYLAAGFTTSLSIPPVTIALLTMACSAPSGLSGQLWGFFFQHLFSSLINVYLLMVVYYHYKELKSGKNRGTIYPSSGVA